MLSQSRGPRLVATTTAVTAIFAMAIFGGALLQNSEPRISQVTTSPSSAASERPPSPSPPPASNRTPAARQQPSATPIEYGARSFMLPAGWFIHRPTFQSWGGSSPVLFLASQPMHDECVRKYSASGSSESCGRPIDELSPGGVLVEWWTSVSFLPELPPGEPVTIDGLNASRSTFEDSYCSRIQADGGYRITVDATGPYSRDSITLCTRSLGGSREAQVASFVDSLRWSDPATPSPSNPPPQTAVADLIGEWRLRSGRVGAHLVPVLRRYPTAMSFNGEAIAGWTPCNRYSANVNADGDRFVVAPIARTVERCSALLWFEEDRIFSALRTITTYELRSDGRVLFMRGPDAYLLFWRLI